MSDLSDNALRLWMGFFLSQGSTLSFGGDHATMEITPEGRSALDELLEAGAVKAVPPLDSYPGREHYGAGETDLRDDLKDRPHLNPFKDTERFVVFRKKQPTTQEAP